MGRSTGSAKGGSIVCCYAAGASPPGPGLAAGGPRRVAAASAGASPEQQVLQSAAWTGAVMHTAPSNIWPHQCIRFCCLRHEAHHSPGPYPGPAWCQTAGSALHKSRYEGKQQVKGYSLEGNVNCTVALAAEGRVPSRCHGHVGRAARQPHPMCSGNVLAPHLAWPTGTRARRWPAGPGWAGSAPPAAAPVWRWCVVKKAWVNASNCCAGSSCSIGGNSSATSKSQRTWNHSSAGLASKQSFMTAAGKARR